MIIANLFTSGKHTQSLIEALKKAKNIKLLNIYKKLNTPEMADVFIVADFGEIISQKILKMPKYGCLGLHPSLLPKYRGASPVQFAIMNGDKETGVSIIKMDEKIDHGPIIAQFKEEIKNDDTTESLYQRLFKAGAEVLVTILPAWVEGKIKPRKQNHSKATYTKRLTRENGKVSWKKSDEEIERFIRAMHSWPGAWSWVNLKGSSEPQFVLKKCKINSATSEKKRLKILKAHLKNGKLILDQVQLEGKKPVSWKQFREGYPKTKILF